MINFIHVSDGSFTNDVYYGDWLSIFWNKHWDKIDKTGLIGKNLLQGKNDYGEWGIFDGLFLAPEINWCLTKIKHGNIDEHKIFRGITFVFDKVDRREHFKILDGDILVAKVPLSWRKSFKSGEAIPRKLRYGSECSKDVSCDRCDKFVNQKEEFAANHDELKTQSPNQCGHMLPWYWDNLKEVGDN